MTTLTRAALVATALLLGRGVDAQVIYNNSSTAAEGYYRGLGGAIQARGQKNLSNSQAAMNLTDARSGQIDNQVKSVNAYWEKKGIYSQHQQQEFYEMERKRQSELARNGLQPLDEQQFNTTTGQIAWPGTLKTSEYSKYRETLDDFFAKRAQSGVLTGDDYMAATAAIKSWQDDIRAQKDKYPMNVLHEMLRFLLSLNRELNDNVS
ncbi:hypothetical protein [Botrimarina sp.]|uniref:hypothetical protein n=1 Tax=Botrimarina sp. TaxID=2795802 RepID=UPI0032EBEC41